MTEWNESRMQELKKHFLKQGEIHSEPNQEKHELSHEAALEDGLALPETLQQILKIGAKWNFVKQSCDCFGCNIIVVHPEKTTNIFGDDECRTEWLEDHGEESCAGKDWALVCVTSEFDFYFVNVRAESAQYGATRHIVNNCYEEDLFTEPPFERFLDIVEAYAKTNAAKVQMKDEDVEDIEYDDFRSFNPLAKV
eukprot:GFUD01073089.1.p1 GENE.GFUD01073089.1~~GFUD01073089.1.p1  ORF type:complete len:195 (+),score=39.19 GFUD01073089.1:85-669(+)